MGMLKPSQILFPINKGVFRCIARAVETLMSSRLSPKSPKVGGYVLSPVYHAHFECF